MIRPSVNFLSLHLWKRQWRRCNRGDVCDRVKIRNLELNMKMFGLFLVSALLLCVCVCLGWGAGIKTGEMCLYTLSTISYGVLNKAYFFPFFGCVILQKHYLIAAQLTLMFLASYVSDLFVPHRSFYYLYFMQCFMLCCSGAPRR